VGSIDEIRPALIKAYTTGYQAGYQKVWIERARQAGVDDGERQARADIESGSRPKNNVNGLGVSVCPACHVPFIRTENARCPRCAGKVEHVDRAEPTATANTQQAAPVETPVVHEPTVSGDEIQVWRSTGSRYHRRDCAHIASTDSTVKAVSLAAAQRAGLTACDRCKPPGHIKAKLMQREPRPGNRSRPSRGLKPLYRRPKSGDEQKGGDTDAANT